MYRSTRRRRRTASRLQFSLRTLLIVALILGPLSGWFGPWVVAQLQHLMIEDPKPPTAVITQQQLLAKVQQLRAKMQKLQMPNQMTSAGIAEEIERGMQLDMLQRQELMESPDY